LKLAKGLHVNYCDSNRRRAMAKVQRCPVCGERVPRKPEGRRGPKLVFCIVTEGACQEVAKHRRLLLAAQEKVIDRTSSANEARMRVRLAGGADSIRTELRGELAAGMERRRRFGESRKQPRDLDLDN
jgi:hypothetical protein